MVHRIRRITLSLVISILVLVTVWPSRPQSRGAPAPVGKGQIQARYDKLPLSFEANQGQTDSQVRFLSRGSGFNLFLTATEAVLDLHKSTTPSTQNVADSAPGVAGAPAEEHTTLRLQLAGANPQPQVAGLDGLPGKVNYFRGNDPARWQSNIPTFARVRYASVYPGVDLMYYGHQGQLENDFIVAPGADPGAIAMVWEGAQQLEVDASGDLVLHTTAGLIRQRAPAVYQEVNGARQEVAAGYILHDRTVGFRLSAYDTAHPLIIDPVLIYSTYLGGSDNDSSLAITLDASGRAYVSGYTYSADFPATAGAFDTSYNGGQEAFVARLSPDGSALEFSTYLGGSDADLGMAGIALDASGNVYVAGNTRSTDFPTVNPFQGSNAGSGDGFIAKLDPTGSALLYATYLGGSRGENLFDLAVDAAGNMYAVGLTSSTNFPTANPLQGSFQGGPCGCDGFITKLNSAGSALIYSTYFGGSADEWIQGIAVDPGGSAYVTGFTGSADFPTTAGAYDTTYNGNEDAFVARFSPGGPPLLYSTYLGGSDGESGIAIAVDAGGNAYVTGSTNSGDFPTTTGAFDTVYNGGSHDGWVTKLDPAGATLAYSTFFGGSGDDYGYGLALDASGDVYVTGYTTSLDFPTLDPVQANNGGLFDVFIFELNPTGSTPVYSTYLGGSGNDYGDDLALDALGNAYLAVETHSTDFPTTAGAYDTTYNGGSMDAGIVKINAVTPTPTNTPVPPTPTYTPVPPTSTNTPVPPTPTYTPVPPTPTNTPVPPTSTNTPAPPTPTYTPTPTPAYAAHVQQPINADGSSVFKANRGVVPVKFTLTLNGVSTCDLPLATIAVYRLGSSGPESVNESVYSTSADSGSNFRMSGCEYIYNLGASSLGTGKYQVDIQINSAVAGSAFFELK